MSVPIDFTQIKRLLLVRMDRMGDVVVTTPVFSAIKKKYPGVYLAVMVAKGNVELVRGNPYLDDVIAYDKEGSEKKWWGAYRFACRLRAQHFDAVILFHPRTRTYWTTFLAKIPIRIGYRLKNYLLLTHRLKHDKPEGKKHEAEYNFDLLKLIGIEQPKELEFYIPLCKAHEGVIDQYLSGVSQYVVFNPSASTPSKIWPAQYFAKVADDLFEKYGVTPVIISGKNDRWLSRAMKECLKHPSVDLTGRLNIGALSWLLKKAKLFISSDSGPVHLAAALGTPVISIFLRNVAGLGPNRWRPLGAHCRYLLEEVITTPEAANDANIELSDIRELTPEKVEKVIEEEGWLIRDPIRH